jgi:hypothetical protein
MCNSFFATGLLEAIRIVVVNTDLSSQAPGAVSDTAIEVTIFELLDARADGATICPSEVARALITGGDDWRGAMPQVRAVARQLASAQRLEVTRRGVEVDATSRGGPIRLGRRATAKKP